MEERDKRIFQLGVSAGMLAKDIFNQNEVEIRSSYMTVLDWEVEEANTLYNIYKEKFPEIFNHTPKQNT
jgi:chorismate synthase